MHNILQQLSQHTIVVADTGDLDAIERLQPVEATTNPALITAAASLPNNLSLLEAAHAQAYAEGLRQDQLIERMITLLTVQLGVRILQRIRGRVSTEVDARLSYDTAATLQQARELVDLYAAAGISTDRILIKIAATWEGIQAAQQLELEGIHCNLTLLFGQHQATACADANVTLISPFVGRILDWQKQQQQRSHIPITEDAGVQSVKHIYTYYKQHGYRTEVMGASFRSIEQIIALAGCDLLTISPALLDQLSQQQGHLPIALSSAWAAQQPTIPKQSLSASQFMQRHKQDLMASTLLRSGIDGFIKAREQLSHQLRQEFGVGDLAV
ncbi:MAG: transaldolase [Pseudomonadota bacterium]|nr:transaldolase [Pseudomonadota bacterium]